MVNPNRGMQQVSNYNNPYAMNNNVPVNYNNPYGYPMLNNNNNVNQNMMGNNGPNNNYAY